MASTRALILWLLDHGHQPQILQMDMAVGTEDWVAAVTAEHKALQQNSDQSISQDFLDQLNELGLNPISTVESSKAINTSVETIWKEHAQASGDLSESLREILEQAITLRGQGDNEKSLALLEKTSGTGERNPWLADNLARCMVNLNRKEEATTIWRSLATSLDRGVAESSLTMVAQMESELTKIDDQTIKEIDSNFSHYANGEYLQKRFFHLRNKQEYAAVSKPNAPNDQCLELAITFRTNGKAEQSLFVLLLTAKDSEYNPWIEDNFARLACDAEDWKRAHKHWNNIVSHSNDINATETALEAIEKLIASGDLEQQTLIEDFGHLLFEESLIRLKQAKKDVIDTSDCAKRFWNYDHSVDEYLSEEINQSIWEDCMGEDLRHAARYLLRNKLYHGLSFLQSIGHDKKIKMSALKKHCAEYFNEEYYIKNRPDLDPKRDLLAHFLEHGWQEGTDPSPQFSTKEYLDSHNTYGINPLYHSLRVKNSNNILSDKLTNDARISSLIQNLSQSKILTRAKSSNNSQALAAEKFQDTSYFDPSKLWKIQSTADNKSSLKIHFVIPDFSKGGGGHMTIFRMIRHLEEQSHRVCIWVINPIRENHAADLREDVVKYFQPIRAKVLPLDSSFHYASGDCIIATGWQTVSYVKKANGFRAKYYFIQDYEPYFYARGTYAVQAEQTYKQDLACICASPWLDKVMKEKFNRWSRFLWLAYDHNIYKTTNEQIQLKYQKLQENQTTHIAVYARSHTERRCVELALESLDQLKKYNSNFVVHFFGDDQLTINPSYPAIDHGILDHEELAELYQFCTIGISFSATNYSLLPQEMMAAGLPVFDLDVESTKAIYPENTIELMEPESNTIAAILNHRIKDLQHLQTQALHALNWVTQFSWERAGNDFEKALVERLDETVNQESENSYKIEIVHQTKKINNPETLFKASIVIPTYNGGQMLRTVLEAVEAQQTPWDFQCLIIDSGSNDQTLEICKEFVGRIKALDIYTIPKEDFQHGYTRNVGVDLSRSEFVAFVTQDSIPANEKWLYNLVNALTSTPNAAGAFGRHIAHDDADPYTIEELKNHFKGFDQFPVTMSLTTDKQKIIEDVEGWRKILHFYSDNNSCLRKSIWKELPLPCVPYGEDQLWADMLIRNGYEKLYVKDAVVKHSHNYDSIETFERAATESKFFSSCFGYDFHQELETVYNAISSDLKTILKDGKRLECTKEQMKRRSANIYAKHLGWLQGNPFT